MITICPECNRSGKLSDELAGSQVRCPQCAVNFVAQAVSQTKWYYAAGDSKVGPIRQEEFDSLVGDGTIAPETLVWCKGMDGWQPLAEVRLVKPTKWYYAAGDGKVGPLRQEEFDSLVGDGTIAPETLVWCKGMAGWQPLSELRPPANTEECDECHGTFVSTLLRNLDGLKVCESCELTLQRAAAGRTISGPGLKYGGLGSRFVAKVIDLTFMLAIGGMVEGLSRKLFPDSYTSNTLSPIIMTTLLINMLLGIFYITWFVGKFSATPGKMVVNLKITNPSGGKISYVHAFGRYCGEYIGALGVMGCLILSIFWAISSFFPANPIPVSLGGTILVTFSVVYGPALFDPQRRTLYDRFCNTRVVSA